MKIHYQPVFTLHFPTLQSHMLEVSITSAFALVESFYTNDLLYLTLRSFPNTAMTTLVRSKYVHGMGRGGGGTTQNPQISTVAQRQEILPQPALSVLWLSIQEGFTHRPQTLTEDYLCRPAVNR